MRIFSTQFLMQKPKSPYKFVDYIESTGTQYIDTGISNMNVFGFEIEYQSTGIYNQSTSNKFDGIFGVNSTGTNADIKIWFNYANQDAVDNRIYCKTAIFQSEVMGLTSYYQNKHTASVKNKIVEWDGKRLGEIEVFATPTRNATIHLFGVNNAGTSSQFRSKTRIYSFKLDDANGNVLINLKPCIRIADNKAGMYDTVSKQFFGNKGTGEFVVGE
jgi:hypothetical protein